MKRKNQGFTLVEVIVAVAILGIIAIGTFGMIRQSQNSYSSNRDDRNLFENGNMAMMVMVREIRRGNVTGYTASSITVNVDVNGVTKSILYGKVGANVVRQQDGVAEVLTPYVTNFTVAPINTNTYRITLTMNVNGKIMEIVDSVTPRNAAAANVL